MLENIDTKISLDDFITKVGVGVTLVVFSAPWCAPCRKMQAVVKGISATERVVEVNVDSNIPLSSHYNIFNVPTLMLLKDGAYQRSLSGYRTSQEVVAFIKGK
jgi:thioredoxin 1